MKALDELPPGLNRCLIGAEISINEAAQREMVLLGGESDIVLIVAEQPTTTGSHSLRDLRTRIARRGFLITKEYRAITGLIPLIYQHFAELNGATTMGTPAVNTRAQQAFDDLVYQAGKAGASDIHIIVRRTTAEILYRIHGELEPVAQWTREQAYAMCACAYTVLAEIRDTTWVPDRRQDANFAHPIQGRVYRIRYAHHPIYPEGVHIVLRILSTGKGIDFAPSLQHLGYHETQVEAITAMVNEPSGIIVISGETGSGKSTTLANLMHIILQSSGGGVSLQTVEDPPEYEVPGVIQSPVIHSREERERGINPYVEAIKSAMRCDPDILVIGEIRDLDTARLAASSAESGHPVLSTVHASRALSIIARLEGMGSTLPNNPVNRALLCAPQFIAGLIHQTLVPTLCQACSVSLEHAIGKKGVDPGLEARIHAVSGGDTGKIRLRGLGCDRCRKGVSGRTVCAEVVTPEPDLLKLLLERRDQEAFEYWLNRDNGYSIRDHAIDKMCAGWLSPVDVEGSLGRLRLESAGAKRERIRCVK